MPQAVLTVVQGNQPDMSNAVALATDMKTKGRIYDWRPAITVEGISVILNDGTSSSDRLKIANEFKNLGYNVIEVP